MKIIDKEKLIDIIEDAEVIDIYDNGYRITAKWKDGAMDSLYYKNNNWHFVDDNIMYPAGYNYACGYKD
jgi:hypothetical protein